MGYNLTIMSNKIKLSKKGGFTLIELLVVISIIGMLSSVVLATTAQARIKAQNAHRLEAMHQIDLAIELYKADNGHAPLLNNTCGKTYFSTAGTGPCKAVQTAVSGNEYTAWQNLQIDLAKYMPKLPKDPCGTNCSGQLGYVYYAPAYEYYKCSLSGSGCDKTKVTESDYGSYTFQANIPSPAGKSTIGGLYDTNLPNRPYSN